MDSIRVKNNASMFNYMQMLANRLKSLGRERSSEIMFSTRRSFMRFRGGTDIRISKLTKNIIEQYEAYLKATGLTRNTSSFYMRNLRSAYKSAVDDGLTNDKQPFRNVYTGVDKTTKRAIDINDIRRIKTLNLKSHSALEFARDMILMIFYMRGISFIDLAYLRKKDMQGGHIIYYRKKTRQKLTVEISPEAQAIINKYKNDSQYLLPIIKKEDGTERTQYQHQLTIINRNLKEIGKKADVSIPLSTYVMRHTWATIARNKGIELYIISKALGHDNELTTQIYLDTISTSRVDKANRMILDDL